MDRIGTPLRLLLLTLGALVLLATFVSVALRHSTPTGPLAPASAKVVVAQPSAARPVQAAPVTLAATRAVRHGQPQVAPAPRLAPTEAGLRAFLDPETGTIGGPTSPEMLAKAVGATTGAPDESTWVVRLPNGAEELMGAPPSYVIAQIDSHGRRVIRSVTDPRQALRKGVPSPLKPEER